jgi:hypothetical protein
MEGGALLAFAAGAGQPWRAVLLVQEKEGGAVLDGGHAGGVASCRSRPGGARGSRHGSAEGGRKGRKKRGKKKREKKEKKTKKRKRKIEKRKIREENRKGI